MEPGRGANAIEIANWAKGITIRNNSFVDNATDGIHMGATANPKIEQILIEGNDFSMTSDEFEWGENGIDIKIVQGPIIVRGNRFSGYRPTHPDGVGHAGGSKGTGLVIHNGAENVFIEANLFINNTNHLNISDRQKVGFAPTRNIRVVNNLFIGAHHYPGSGNRPSGPGIALRINDVQENLEINHNTFIDNDIFLGTASGAIVATFHNNAIRDGQAQFEGSVNWQTGHNAWANLTAKMPKSLRGEGDLELADLRLDEQFRPLPDSPLINQGLPLGVEVDFAGNPRHDGQPDVGAFESDSAGPGTVYITIEGLPSELYPAEPLELVVKLATPETLARLEADCSVEPSLLAWQAVTLAGQPLVSDEQLDPDSGQWLAKLQVDPGRPFLGPDGRLVHFHFTAIAPGSTPLNCTWLALNEAGDELPLVVTPTSLTILAPPPTALAGQAGYQGRDNQADLEIQATGPLTLSTATQPDGQFVLDNLTAGTYQLTATADRYLPNCLSSSLAPGQTLTLSPTLVLGGDVDNDQAITETDNQSVRQNLGLSATSSPLMDPLADLNNDGQVDVKDFAMLNGNFAKSGCQPWQPGLEPVEPPAPTGQALAGCDHLIGPEVSLADGIGNYAGVGPGQVVCLSGGPRGPLTLRNFTGQPGSPITFINEGGTVLIEAGVEHYGLRIQNSAHFRLTGGGSSDRYGLKVRGATGRGVQVGWKSHDFTLDHLEVSEINGSGIVAHTIGTCPDGSANDYDYDIDGQIRGDLNDVIVPQNFLQTNVVVADNYVHQVNDKGIRIGFLDDEPEERLPCAGNTNAPIPNPDPVWSGITIYNNRVEQVNGDGLRVGSAIGACHIHHNYLAQVSLVWQTSRLQGGIKNSPDSSCDIYSNFVKDSGENGILVRSAGNNQIYNNVIVNPGQSNQTGSGIMFVRQSDLAGQALIFNNTIINPADYGLLYRGEVSSPDLIDHNLIVRPGPDQEHYIRLNGQANVTVTDNFTTAELAEAGFIDPATDNYQLGPDSPAQGKGAQLDPVLLKLVERPGLQLNLVASAPLLAPGSALQVRLMLEQAVGLYGLQVDCRVEPAGLIWQGAAFDAFFTEAVVGVDGLDPANGQWFGLISQRNPGPARSGAGHFATLQFQAGQAGLARLTCVPLAVDRDGLALPVSVVSDPIFIRPEPLLNPAESGASLNLTAPPALLTRQEATPATPVAANDHPAEVSPPVAGPTAAPLQAPQAAQPGLAAEAALSQGGEAGPGAPAEEIGIPAEPALPAELVQLDPAAWGEQVKLPLPPAGPATVAPANLLAALVASLPAASSGPAFGPAPETATALPPLPPLARPYALAATRHNRQQPLAELLFVGSGFWVAVGLAGGFGLAGAWLWLWLSRTRRNRVGRWPHRTASKFQRNSRPKSFGKG
jgi:hypothetical protein